MKKIYLIYNAVYLAIFLEFVRRVVRKFQIAFEIEIPFEQHAECGEFYVLANGISIWYDGKKATCAAFIVAAEGRCPGIHRKLSIVESDADYVLQDVSEPIMELTQVEQDALNATIDEFAE